MRRSILGFLLATALACAGLPADPPPAPVPAPSPPPPAAPAFDRTRHDGLHDGLPSWELQVTTHPEPAFVVILWGSADEAEAWAWLERYAAAGGPMRERFPYVAASKYFPGLKPGLFVVIAAQPDDEATAKAIAAAFKGASVPGVDVSGAYVRSTEVFNLREEHLDPKSVVP